MLKKDQCWRCDHICTTPTPKIYCSGCEVAYYCSEKCKHGDVFRHQVDCQTAALKRRCSGCGKENRGLKQCDEDILRRQRGHASTATIYYWGNIPAKDLINFPQNEGCEYSKPFAVLACGVGDPRNIVLSVSQLPEAYQEEVTFVLNDICACTLARTVLILYLIFKGGEQVANSVTQIWYSLRLSEEDHQLVINTLQELIQASSLEELTRGTMKIEQDQLHNLVQVWRTWLDLSSRKGNWITEARRRMFESDPGSKDGIDLYLKEIPKEHKKSASDWFANGILLPKESRKRLTHENFTLSGSDFQVSGNKGAFSYIIQSSVSPFTSWDYKDAQQLSDSVSILKMYSEYVSHVLKKCAMTLATGQVKFHFLLCNCLEMTPFLPPDRKYDRVTTSNIADFVPLANLLDTCKPLLNLNNPSSVIITEFQNWVRFTNLIMEAEKRAFDMVRGDPFRKRILEDTKNSAIAYSTARQAFAEYHDHSAEFAMFLRAALLASEVPDERNRRRTWKSVADYNGIIARNFLRCQNRVSGPPARWLLNCRRVTLLNGFERAVEWIVKPR
ncbi:hypothetical protein OS493_009953 [Desmophyllum pertusum]|uniref:MYND-type domain-containing protein n=1 Tax=Desmophyllum pertusum TaxID=174260 RepID=A0A9X0CHA3_9CNID|nr:hypothetical protein OS493_009953 [Desmophyllum pertusum]